MNLEDIRIELLSVADRLKCGCGNTGCKIKKPIGQATNALCQCCPRRISNRLLNLAAEIEQLNQNFEKNE